MTSRLSVELLVFILLLGTASGFLLHPAHATNNAVVIAPVVIDPSLGPGSIATLGINVSNIGPIPETLYAWQLFLKVDPSILNITQVIEGPALTEAANKIAGTTLFTGLFNTTIGLAGGDDILVPPTANFTEGLVGNGTLVYIKARVLAYGTTDLILNNTSLISINPHGYTHIGHIDENGVFSNVPYNVPPVASFTMSPFPTTIRAGSPVHFDASRSYDRDGTIVKYRWNFGDGNITSVSYPKIDHTYTTPGGPFKVILAITDNGGATASMNTTLYVGRAIPSPPTASFTFFPANPGIGEDVTFDGTASTVVPGDSFSNRSPFTWDFGDGFSHTGHVVKHRFNLAGIFNVTLYVSDLYSQSSNSTKTIKVAPPLAPLNVSTFFTDTKRRPLPNDTSGKPTIVAIFEDGQISATDPRQVLIWINVTNTSGSPLQSLTLNETLPSDWTIPERTSSRSVHLYFARSPGSVKLVDITRSSIITVSGLRTSGEHVNIAIPDFNQTNIGHPLMPNQTILVSIKISYTLEDTSQSTKTYPRDYTNYATSTGWTEPMFKERHTRNANTATFTVHIKNIDDEDGEIDLGKSRDSIFNLPPFSNPTVLAILEDL